MENIHLLDDNKYLLQTDLVGLDTSYLKECSKDIFYISDIHIMHKLLNEYKSSIDKNNITEYVNYIVNGLFTEDLICSIRSYRDTIILFAGDISSEFEITKEFYTEFVRRYREIKGYTKVYVYAILGNHEYWSFKSIEDCTSAYEVLFKSLGIIFLDNTLTWLGDYRLAYRVIRDDKGKFVDIERNERGRARHLKREEDPEEYDRQMIYTPNMMIVGGTGFAGSNQQFNASNGIYKDSINRSQELDETNRWNTIYNKAIEMSRENNCMLVILTHNPMSDWSNKFINNVNTVYINGHTHKNEMYNDFDNNIHIISDNQIGYENKLIKFKEIHIFKRINPFINYSDGYHNITPKDYLRFNYCINEIIQGTTMIENHINSYGWGFYMIKHEGYYGFFLISDKYNYICMGGSFKKIGKSNGIEELDKQFTEIIQKYLKLVSPYRNAQENISKFVKSFGGSGKIHGTIIDIDFLNHIMLNPLDGTITYYYAPMFGLAQKYDNMLDLLEDRNEQLANNYKKVLDIKENNIIEKTNIENKLEHIDIKNSIYSTSRKLNQIQRLFDKKVLRDWDIKILSI